ncbi:hypothetical protein COW36_15070 [bacterium (Candidatus Blackallbacteria) CG17_big_fil_post_rev_8_21_14_2_50_48_46]|uniref:AB hydrolase-1 domain-containing protein n=1 Tax=bacterium (Candidatus Blackallbacteria) CG17_big_fil_post_rev_8_21_14_2_50_48_46 TaxID=2014261 RepID=A0A2M7G2M1_9BACT|nr:MAG: hypothetical protein COW64_11480 [bacterium (Candidatus Blackallbacteria) CG18_big_fil_WC_8_21_14_2_50_49_26]PIW16031.1 MAG: hypothetical protein COW36_15070 [bacterium (Candidatus Blackallbacteria) CG17_big_fil_post_rev_8_21_14_2_50_48_46]PIW50443.1 MAG: hypothetical protein COW20_02785 [bacterium (Candidatus Blackallbacteria) CG13_big_fil_rev_8_21_14_2_50_49_14]
MQQESLFLNLSSVTALHLRHIWIQQGGPIVWMLHGAIENGKIFYTEQGKGLACFLAKAGYEVYVSDLGGRGRSSPPIHSRHTYSQTSAICQELPAVHNWLRQRHPKQPQVWIAHSWGGVLFFALMARQMLNAQPKAVVCFGTKRSVLVKNFDRLILIEAVWKRFAYFLSALYGYLPARAWKFGSDNESSLSHHQSVCWVKAGPWIDPEDQFDYGQALKEIDLPPALFLTGVKDRCLGHGEDVQRFIAELAHPGAEFHLIGKQGGYKHDYDHIDLLTHQDAPADHFKFVLRWLAAQV